MIYLIFTLYIALWFAFGSSIWSFTYTASLRYVEKTDFVKGKSRCPNCKNLLKPVHLIPILSYIFLHGKCAYCKSIISVKYFLYELAGAVFSLFSLFYVSNIFENGYFSLCNLKNMVLGILLFLILTVLFSISVIDLKIMEIPDLCTLILLLLSVLFALISNEISAMERLIGFFTSSTFYFAVSLVVKDAFGFGDVKLSAVLGLFFGWKLSLVSLFFSILTGGVYGIYVMTTQENGSKKHFAFAPFICLSVIITLILGKPLVSWYSQMLSIF